MKIEVNTGLDPNLSTTSVKKLKWYHTKSMSNNNLLKQHKISKNTKIISLPQQCKKTYNFIDID